MRQVKVRGDDAMSGIQLCKIGWLGGIEATTSFSYLDFGMLCGASDFHMPSLWHRWSRVC
jgi:hypothetical protein